MELQFLAKQKLPKTLQGITSGWLQVTPTMAKAFQKNAEAAKFVNRGISEASVLKYTNDMKNDNWHSETADPIHLVNEGGVLFHVNGNHRLTGIIASNKPQILFVVVGVPRDAFKYYDHGRVRDLTQIMEIDHNESDGNRWVNYRPQSTSARLLWKEDKSGNPTKRPDASDTENEGGILEYITEIYGDELDRIFTKYGEHLSKIQRGPNVPPGQKRHGYGPMGIWGWFATRASAKNLGMVDDVLSYCANPMEVQPPCSVWKYALAYIGKMREELAEPDRSGANGGKLVKGRHKDFSDAVTECLAVCWNAHRNGDRINSVVGVGRLVEQQASKWKAIK